ASSPTRSRSTPSPACSSPRAAMAARSTCATRRRTCSRCSPSSGSPTCCRRDRPLLARVLQRQAEQRENALGVEEERELGDLAAFEAHDLQRPRLVAVVAV